MNNKEIWKDVPNFEGLYQISNLGRIKVLHYGKRDIVKIVEPTKGKNGNRAIFRKEGKIYEFSLARLVYFLFHPEENNKNTIKGKRFTFYVKHKDENKYNDILENLYLVPYSEIIKKMHKNMDYWFNRKIVHIYKENELYKSCKNLKEMQMIFPFNKEEIHKLSESQEEFIYNDERYHFEIEHIEIKQESPVEERIEDLPNEVWKLFQDKYQISNMGRVKSTCGIKHPYTVLLNQKTRKDKTKSVTFYIDGESKEFSVHRLVAELFISKDNYPEDIQDKLVIYHIDNDKTNNKVENLKWITISEARQLSFNQNYLKHNQSMTKIYAIDIIYGNVYYFSSLSEASKFFNIERTLLAYYLDTHKRYKKYKLYIIPNKLLERHDKK